MLDGDLDAALEGAARISDKFAVWTSSRANDWRCKHLVLVVITLVHRFLFFGHLTPILGLVSEHKESAISLDIEWNVGHELIAAMKLDPLLVGQLYS